MRHANMTESFHPPGTPASLLPRRARHAEEGYALLMVIFLVALVMVGLASAIPDVLQQGRREKEAELMYRGKQYQRGVKLYYKKMGKYPQTIEDITKEQNGIHFMRKAYKDPVNPEDGSWRLIYVTSSGVLINSLLYNSLQDMVAKLRPNSGISFGAPPGGTPVNGQPGGGIPGLSSGSGSGFGSSSGSGSGGSSGFGGSESSNNPQQSSSSQSGSPSGNGPVGSNQGGTGQSGPTNSIYQSGGGPAGGGQPGGPSGQSGQPNIPGQPGGFGAPGSGSPNGTSGDQSSSAGTDVSDSDTTGQVFGGNLTGVASKMDKASIKVFQTGKTYKKWEFIWNPQLDAAAAAPGGGGVTPQGVNGAPGQPGGPTTPFGSAPGATGVPTPQAPQPSPTGGSGG
jgi:uncharacterized membrane protein YgcG